MDKKTQLATEFAKLTPIEETITRSMSFLPQDADGETARKFTQAVFEGMDFKQLEANIIAVAASVYSEEELEAAIAFCNTPIGLSFHQKQVECMVKTQLANSPIIMDHMAKPEVQERLEAIMDELDL